MYFISNKLVVNPILHKIIINLFYSKLCILASLSCTNSYFHNGYALAYNSGIFISSFYLNLLMFCHIFYDFTSILGYPEHQPLFDVVLDHFRLNCFRSLFHLLIFVLLIFLVLPFFVKWGVSI